MKTKTLNRAASAAIVGGLLFGAVPSIAHPASATAATQVRVAPVTPKGAPTRASVAAKAVRIKGNRVRLVVAAPRTTKRVIVRYKFGKMRATQPRARLGIARIVLPARTTRILVRVPGTRWVAVGIPRITAPQPKPQPQPAPLPDDPALGEDTWQDHLPPPPDLSDWIPNPEWTYAPMSATEFADETFAEINAMRASGITCDGVWMPPVAPFTRNSQLDAAGFASAPFGNSDPVSPADRAGMPAYRFTVGLVRPSGTSGPRTSALVGPGYAWYCRALMSPTATIAGVGAEDPDPNPGDKISRFVSIYFASSAG